MNVINLSWCRTWIETKVREPLDPMKCSCLPFHFVTNWPFLNEMVDSSWKSCPDVSRYLQAFVLEHFSPWGGVGVDWLLQVSQCNLTFFCLQIVFVGVYLLTPGNRGVLRPGDLEAGLVGGPSGEGSAPLVDMNPPPSMHARHPSDLFSADRAEDQVRNLPGRLSSETFLW